MRSLRNALVAVLVLGCLGGAAANARAAPPARDGAPGNAARPGEPDQAAIDAENQLCLDCHGDPEFAPSIKLEKGGTMSLLTDAAVLAGSVHAQVACKDCHSDLEDATEDGHKIHRFPDRRAFTVAYSEQCKQCHFQNYTKTHDSVHGALITKGVLGAAVCVDCHGAHDTGLASQPRSKISQTCSQCHRAISEVYSRSVHGQSLLAEENPDVPTCTDCHRSHDIADPRQGSWIARTPTLCGNCHTNAPLMAKYELSTNVLSSYLADFHGMTAALQANDALRPQVALCTDCHGVHDIARVNDPNSSVMKANLAKTCAKCHPGAGEDFPGAWLSHYEPTWEKAPIVTAVTVFYDFLIPFMIAGLLLQIALHLWRVVVNR